MGVASTVASRIDAPGVEFRLIWHGPFAARHAEGLHLKSEPIRTLILRKIAEGRLSAEDTSTVRGGLGVGESCDACDKAITFDHLFLRTGPDSHALSNRFHTGCFYIWLTARQGAVPGVERIAAKLKAGNLPSTGWDRVRIVAGGLGNCYACEESILATDVGAECRAASGTVRLHSYCFVIYEELRAASPSTTIAHGENGDRVVALDGPASSVIE
jgi:hypothetical protein